MWFLIFKIRKFEWERWGFGFVRMFVMVKFNWDYGSGKDVFRISCNFVVF